MLEDPLCNLIANFSFYLIHLKHYVTILLQLMFIEGFASIIFEFRELEGKARFNVSFYKLKQTTEVREA
jgi:hypothetical protein